MIFILPLLLAFLPAFPAHAWEKPASPDYAQLTKTADIAVHGEVLRVDLAKSWDHLSKVVIRVDYVTKGKLSNGSKLEVFYKPDEITDSTIRQFRCPRFPEFTVGKSYMIWAYWDPKEQCYIVPEIKWTLKK
jgi:hypothetical protein